MPSIKCQRSRRKTRSLLYIQRRTKHQRTTFTNVVNLFSRNITIVEETLLNMDFHFVPLH